MDTDVLVAVGTVVGVLVALILGVIGLAQSSRARTEAATSNKIATDANALAAEANRIVDEEARRARERSDVAWEWRWDDTYLEHVIVQNTGKGRALAVVAQFYFDTVTEANDANPTDMDGRTEMKLAVRTLQQRRGEARDFEEITRDGGMMAGFDPTETTTAITRLRVNWTTPLGTPKTYDTGYWRSSLSGRGGVLEGMPIVPGQP